MARFHVMALLLATAFSTSVHAQDPAQSPEDAAAPPDSMELPVILGEPSDGAFLDPSIAYAKPDPFAATPPPPAPPSADDADHPQGRTAMNALFGEVGGPGMLYSINYERMLNGDFGLRVGVAFLGLGGFDRRGRSVSDSVLFAAPVSLNYIGLGSGSHHFELGLGITALYTSAGVDRLFVASDEAGVRPVGEFHLGYRRQPLSGGFNWRIGASVMVGPGIGFDVTVPDRIGVMPWAYLSFGYSL